MEKISIIVPVYNEVKTIKTLLNNLLNLDLKSIKIKKEIIVIDSNSKDGSYEILKEFKIKKKITLLKQKNPKGTGHAGRAGSKVATGDMIAIQDADLEYNVNDYEKLLIPIIKKKTNFVLGTRHRYLNPFKMREMKEFPLHAFFLNLGHVILQSLFNILYQIKLTDIFTMYKIFRKKSIQNIDFFCDRFDFDCELVCKLIINKNFPIEIPIRYKSRDFAQGKKVSFFKDPPKILWAMIKIKILGR